MITILRMSSKSSKWLTKEEFIMKELEKTPIFLVGFFSCDNLLKICYLFQAMLFFMPFTPSYAIFYAIYVPRSSAIFFLNFMLQYIALTPSYANSSYAMFSGQSWGRISGYCCMHKFKKKCLTYCNLSKISWHFILEVTSHVTELRRNWVRCPPYCKNW